MTRFFIVTDKTVNDSQVCDTFKCAVSCITDDTTAVIMIDLDHNRIPHAYLCSDLAAEQWLDDNRSAIEYDYQYEAQVPRFIRDSAPAKLREFEEAAFEADIGERGEAWSHRYSVGVRIGI